MYDDGAAQGSELSPLVDDEVEEEDEDEEEEEGDASLPVQLLNFNTINTESPGAKKLWLTQWQALLKYRPLLVQVPHILFVVIPVFYILKCVHVYTMCRICCIKWDSSIPTLALSY